MFTAFGSRVSGTGEFLGGEGFNFSLEELGSLVTFLLLALTAGSYKIHDLFFHSVRSVEHPSVYQAVFQAPGTWQGARHPDGCF